MSNQQSGGNFCICSYTKDKNIILMSHKHTNGIKLKLQSVDAYCQLALNSFLDYKHPAILTPLQP